MICNTEVITSTQPCDVLAIPLPVPYQENKYFIDHIDILNVYESKKKIIKCNYTFLNITSSLSD